MVPRLRRARSLTMKSPAQHLPFHRKIYEFTGGYTIWADDGRGPGDSLWRFSNGSPAIVQPQQLNDTGLIIPFGDDKGVGYIELTSAPDANWGVQEKWRTRSIKPWYNDYLYHDGHVYGFDKQFFVCVDTQDGSLKWKSRKFGFGQAILVQSTGQVVMLSEDGEVRLIDVSPVESKQLGSVQVLNDTCWNHPIIAGGRLYVRNSVEMVCLELPQ